MNECSIAQILMKFPKIEDVQEGVRKEGLEVKRKRRARAWE